MLKVHWWSFLLQGSLSRMQLRALLCAASSDRKRQRSSSQSHLQLFRRSREQHAESSCNAQVKATARAQKAVKDSPLDLPQVITEAIVPVQCLARLWLSMHACDHATCDQGVGASLIACKVLAPASLAWILSSIAQCTPCLQTAPADSMGTLCLLHLESHNRPCTPGLK